MNMICGTADAEAFAALVSRDGCEIGVEVGWVGDGWRAVFGAEDDVDQGEYERLWHARIIERAFGPYLICAGLPRPSA